MIGRKDHGGAPCATAGSLEDEEAREAAERFGLTLPQRPASLRRPGTSVEDGQIHLVLFVLREQEDQLPLEVFARREGVLLVGEDEALEAVDAALEKDHADGFETAVRIVLAVARHSEDVLDRLEERCEELEARSEGYTASPHRRTMARLRARLFQIEQSQATLATLMSADEELAQELGEEHRRLVRRARVAFEANRGLAARLYALLGDVLDEQNTAVSERLTLVATIFMPPTVATGFFGMNFGWMEDQIGGLGAFLLLGVGAPVAITLLTVAIVARLTRSS